LYHGKDKFEGIFDVVNEVLFSKNNIPNNTRLLNEIREKVMSHGDTELVNDFVY
jgi:hypothetical protein